MKRHLYLSLIPESLIASQLDPGDFGLYYATGSRKRSRGQAIFFEIDPGWDGGGFDLEYADRRCVSHPDGSPRRSVYLGIYRALERVPVSALRALYLTTGDGRTLELQHSRHVPSDAEERHLYQELCPVTPRVVSTLEPAAFARFITDPAKPVSVNRIVFCELLLNALSVDPESDAVGDLPYRNIGHLRDCLREVHSRESKVTKVVNRSMTNELLYRTIKNGLFVGDQTDFRYYPLPSRDSLEREHYEWWRSAQNVVRK